MSGRNLPPRPVLGRASWEDACDGCGVVHDRDLNAAINLRSVAESSLAAASPSGRPGGSVTACGAEGSGLGLAALLHPQLQRAEHAAQLHQVTPVLVRA